MNKLKMFTSVFCILFSTTALSGVPAGDTVGKVAAVVTWYSVNNANTIRIYFDTVTVDIRGCHSGQGYVEVTDANSTVTTEGLSQIFSSALAAKTTGAQFALMSPPNSCSANSGYVMN
jgi:hypothetical protein